MRNVTGLDQSSRYSVRRAVRLALALGTIAACGAGSLAAHAEQATTTPPVKQLNAAKTTAKTTKAKTTTASAPLLLAQATQAPLAGPAPQAESAPAAGSAPQVLQTIVVTGSLISQTGVVTPSPVQIIPKTQIIQTGYTNISDVLRNLSANGASTLSQSFTFAFATGGAGVSLRGLSVGDTLVLVDGERTVPYPALDDNERDFVDVSSIPFTAVQQVQVLRDGGSALYGSDAIAGVVNVILRKEYQGFETTAEAGTSSHWDGSTEHFGFIGGMGDLASDGYNWYISGDFRHQDQILADNRSGLWDSLNFTQWGGFDVTKGHINPNVPYPFSATGYLINPNDPSLSAAAFLPGCNYTALELNECSAMAPGGSDLQPEAGSIDLLGKFTKELGNAWELGVQASWFDSTTDGASQYFANIASANQQGAVDVTAFKNGVPPYEISYPLITVPAGYPGNPFGQPAQLIDVFPELSNNRNPTDTNTYRLLVSLTGNVAGWDIKGTAGAMFSETDLTQTDLIAPAALQDALNNGYILGSPSGTSLFAPNASTKLTSNMDLIDIHGTHKLFEMPGGPLSLAVGVQWNKEGHDVTAPPTVAAGIQAAGNPAYSVGNEYDRALFAELQGSPIKQVDIDLEARYDNYKTFGSDTTPKIGIKFTPWQWIALRGTWSKGFRVPSVAEGVASGSAFGAGTFQDPVLCPTNVPTGKVAGPGDYVTTCDFNLEGVELANPHLKDVTSTNFTTGFVLQPIDQASVSVDYYNIKINNDIIPAFEAGGLGVGSISLVRGAPSPLPYCPPSMTDGCTAAQTVSTTTPVGVILYQAYPYVNASSTSVSGYDIDLLYHWNWGRFGRFTGEATWTHELTYKLTVAGSTYELAGTHGPSGVSGDTGNPKDRFNVSLSWIKGPLTITPSASFISHFSIVDPSSGIPTCGDAIAYNNLFPPGPVTAAEQNFCTVKYFLEAGLYASYQMSGSLEVHASVRNLFNKQPPVDVQTYGGGAYFYPYDPALDEDGVMGRFMTVGVTYTMD